MISYETLNSRLSKTLQQDPTIDELNTLKTEWDGQVKKLDAFIQMLLDRAGHKLLGEKKDTPEWVLFSRKSEEYSSYVKAIKSVNYFIAKKNGTN